MTPTEEGNLTDPWVVYENGTLRYVEAAVPPLSTVVCRLTPMRRSRFWSVWREEFADVFFAWTGRQASADEIVSVLRWAYSAGGLIEWLEQAEGFSASPMFARELKQTMSDS